MQTEPQDFNKKILHASWHPREATVAVSGGCFVLSYPSPLSALERALEVGADDVFADRRDEQSLCLYRRVDRRSRHADFRLQTSEPTTTCFPALLND
jgi:hypothetical protein